MHNKIIGGQQCTIQLQPYVINLKSAFGTSHSITTTRTNALFSFTCHQITGYGEVGLPPKKKDIYFSDMKDVEQVLKQFLEVDSDKKDIFSNLLDMLDQIPNENEFLPGKSGLECAFFDWQGKWMKVPVYSLLPYKQQLKSVASCFTLSLLDNIEDVIKMIKQGEMYTPYLKIKVGNDLQYIMELLNRIQLKGDGFICLDCNCSWSVDIAIKFGQLIQNHEKKDKIYMIEQPFGIEINDDWKDIKQIYDKLGIEIFADESMKRSDDIVRLEQYCSGINVKLEKTGGYRGAVEALKLGEQRNMKKWIGIMIGSSLNSSQAAHLGHYASKGVDIDGPLHVEQNSDLFIQGFEQGLQNSLDWGLLRLKNDIIGLGVQKK